MPNDEESPATVSTASSSGMSRRVANNAVIGLAEIVAVSLISIVNVRFMFRVLGVVDYGLFTALGASGLFAALIISGFDNAALRFLALSAGTSDPSPLRSTMASTVVFYLGVSLLIAAIAFGLRGRILDLLTIPSSRRDAASLVFLSVAGQFCVGAIVAPFAALRQAHQRFGLLSIAELVQRSVVLAALAVFSFSPSLADDTLVSVAWVALAAALVRGALVVVPTILTLPGGKFRLRDSGADIIRDIAKFARWSILASVSIQGRKQLAVVLINIGFGAVANAAYAIGLNASTMLQRFARSFNMALQPAITSLYGSDKDRSLAGLISVGCRYSPLILLAPLATLLVGIDDFLQLWIGDVPANTGRYAQLISLAVFSRLFTFGHSAAINATDRMRAGTILGVGVDIVAVGSGTFAILVAGAPGWALPATLVAGNWVRNVVYAAYFGPGYEFALSCWLRDVVVPLLSGFLVVCAAAWLVHSLVSGGLAGLLLIAVVSTFTTAAVFRWMVSFEEERVLLASWIQRAN